MSNNVLTHGICHPWIMKRTGKKKIFQGNHDGFPVNRRGIQGNHDGFPEKPSWFRLETVVVSPGNHDDFPVKPSWLMKLPRRFFKKPSWYVLKFPS